VIKPSLLSSFVRLWFVIFPLVLACIACSSGGGTGLPADGGNPDGGSNQLPSAGGTLDSTPMAATPVSIAVGPGDKIGVAYFRDVAGSDGGTNYQVRYVEWQNGHASASELVQTVALQYGISLAFRSNGLPAIAYLGGADDGRQSLFWINSDAAVSYKQSGGSWTESIAVRLSNEAFCNSALSDNGWVVGLNPSLVFVGSTAYLFYRDVHEGQYLFDQDWEGSDFEVAIGIGEPPAWSHVPIHCAGAPGTTCQSGNCVQAYGAHSFAVVAGGGQPAVVTDQLHGAGAGPGTNVIFHKRNADGSWSAKEFPPAMSVTNTQQGPSLAYDGVLGFAVAVVERSTNTLYFIKSDTGTGLWTVPDPVFQSGTGGWYPSIAVDPSIHEPVIAYYVCSRQNNVAEGACPLAETQLKLASRFGTVWNHALLDSHGGVLPKLAFLSNGKRAVAYRDPATGALKLFLDP
jgi:hypothetical protein